MSLEAQDRSPDGEGDQRGQSGAADEGEPRRQVQVGRPDGDRVRADPHEAGVAQAHLPGETHQQIEPDGGEGEHEHQRRDAIVISGRENERQQDDDRGHRKRGEKPMIQEPSHEALDALSIPVPGCDRAHGRDAV